MSLKVKDKILFEKYGKKLKNLWALILTPNLLVAMMINT